MVSNLELYTSCHDTFFNAQMLKKEVIQGTSLLSRLQEGKPLTQQKQATNQQIIMLNSISAILSIIIISVKNPDGLEPIIPYFLARKQVFILGGSSWWQ